MNTATNLGFLILVGVSILYFGGVNTSTFLVFLLAAGLGAVLWYFETRDRNAPPSLTEIVVATIWIWLRRLVGFGMGSYFLFGAFTTVTSNPDKKSFEDMWLTALALAAGGLYFLYLGYFGRGHKSAELRDDIRLHSENKNRYRWWF
jgi:hypothetical protein